MENMQTERPLSPKQREMIVALVTERDINPEQVRVTIHNISGKSRMDEMNVFEASKVIDELKRVPKTVSSHNNDVGTSNSPLMATARQLEFINDMVDEKRLGPEDFEKLLRKVIGKPSVDDLSRDEASLIITALKEYSCGTQRKSEANKSPSKETSSKSGWQPKDDYR